VLGDDGVGFFERYFSFNALMGEGQSSVCNRRGFAGIGLCNIVSDT